MVEIHILLIFMIGAAIIAMEVKDLVSSVVAVGAVGIGLCMAFLVLKAPDLAMTQLVVEVLSLIILIRATIRKDIPFSVSGRWFFNTLSTLSFMAIFVAAAYFALKSLPAFGQPIMKLAKFYFDKAPAMGSENVVSAIVLNYRIYDALGEATVLFAALIGVLAIARKAGRARE